MLFTSLITGAVTAVRDRGMADLPRHCRPTLHETCTQRGKQAWACMSKLVHVHAEPESSVYMFLMHMHAHLDPAAYMQNAIQPHESHMRILKSDTNFPTSLSNGQA